MPSRPLRARRAVAAAVALLVLACAAGPAAAAPAPSGDAAPGTRDLGILNERYNATRLRLQEATTALQTLQDRIDDTRTRVDGVRTLVRARAARLYRSAAGGDIASVLDVQSVSDFARRTQYVDAAAKPDRALMRDLTESLEQLAGERAAASAARERLKAEADAAAAARRRLMAEAAAARRRAAPTGDGAGPAGTPRAMLVASSGSSARTGASPSATPAPVPTTTPPSPGPAPTPTPPAPSSRTATVVAFARAQLGKPYAFATSGPNTFDCSGLTMAAWRAAGVSMDHYSVSQANAFPRVGWSQLQPGDIVVFYPDYHHVGIYIGGGSMIHAGRTGDVVKVAPAWRETFQFGVRPR